MLALLVTVSAFAQDLQQQAEAMMHFDFDEVETRIERSKRKARPAPAAYPGDPYGEDLPPSVPVPVQRLPLESNSTLDAVTVHRDRAMVTRHRELEIEAGTHTVTFEGLPLGISSEGLSASIQGGTARIVSVELLSGSGKVIDTDRIDAIRAEAEKLVEQLGDVRDRIESLLAQRQYLRTALSPASSTSGQSVAQVRSGLDFVASSEERIAGELREQQHEAEELAKALDPLLVKLEDPLATGQPVRIDVDAEKKGKVRVLLQYAVPGAGWTPSYSARLDPSSGVVELEMYGVVRQSSGEDWTNAEIALSTAEPAGRASVLSLTPWTLGRSGGVGVLLDQGTGAITAAPPGSGGSGGVVDARLDAQVGGSGAVVLGIAGKRTIRGDGSPQRLPVGVQKLQSTLALATVPKLAPEVGRRAVVRYDGELPLLPGPASSFVGGDYVGSGQISAVLPGETLELGFGTDERFRVSRQLVSRQRERVGRKATRYTFRFRTTVANHGDAAATIELSDQLPLSEDSRIDVKVLDLSGGRSSAEDGVVRWAPSVPAHGEASVELSFSVLVPEDLSYLAQDFEMLY